ncbi:MAG: hypothetical protein UX78_C0017G0012, partial [Candidatus Amesbacteria bacterium GW2011_GWA2_47_11]
MSKFLPTTTEHSRLTIQEAAVFLQVSAKTLRRWEKAGFLIPERTPGNQRRYNLQQLKSFSFSKKPVLTHPAFSPRSHLFLPSLTVPRFKFPSTRIILPLVTLALSSFFLLNPSTLNFLKSNLPSLVTPGLRTSPEVTQLSSAVSEIANQVLASETALNDFTFGVNVISSFAEDSTFRKNLTVEGLLTAPNIIYSIKAGENITITPGQNPTISATGGVTSLQGSTGEVSLSAGGGISISGLTISNSDLGSSQKIWKTIKVTGQSDLVAGSNTDELTFAAGTGIGLTTNTTDKKLTVAVSTIPTTAGGTNLTSYTTGDILYASDTNTLAKLPIGSSGQSLTVSGGIPAWASGSSSNWQRNSGALAPLNITDDLLLGGTSTASATFQVISSTGSITTAGDLALNGSDLTSDSNLTLNAAGYTRIGDTGTPGSATGDDDLYVEGDLEIDAALILGSDSITDITGNGLIVSSSALTINLPSATDALSSTTSSGSGLEALSAGLTLLQGCSDAQILKWNETTDVWECASDSGASSAIINVENNDVAVGVNVDTLDFSTDFSVTASPTNEANVAIADDILNFTEFSDSLSLDAPTTITNSLSGNFILDLTSTGDFVISDAGTPFAEFTDSGTFTLDSLTLDGTSLDSSAALNLGTASATSINIGSSAISTTVASNLTLTTGRTLTINSDAFTDLTGNGLAVSSGSLAINITTSGTTGSTSSNSGLEVGSSGLTLLKGCADNELLKWTDAGGWACATDTSGGLSQYWQLNSNVLAPGGSATVTDRLVLGGQTSTVHQLEINGAVTGKALVALTETGDQNILTASTSASTTVFNLGRT